jgi:hypothetical protein
VNEGAQIADTCFPPETLNNVLRIDYQRNRSARAATKVAKPAKSASDRPGIAIRSATPDAKSAAADANSFTRLRTNGAASPAAAANSGQVVSSISASVAHLAIFIASFGESSRYATVDRRS